MFSNINQIFLFIGTFTNVDKNMHQKGANVVRKWGAGGGEAGYAKYQNWSSSFAAARSYAFYLTG